MKYFDEDYAEHKRKMLEGNTDSKKLEDLKGRFSVVCSEVEHLREINDRLERKVIDYKRELDFIKAGIKK